MSREEFRQLRVGPAVGPVISNIEQPIQDSASLAIGRPHKPGSDSTKRTTVFGQLECPP